MESSLTLRTIRHDEYPALRRALYLAVFQPPDAPPLDESILQLPALRRYISGYGRLGDMGLFAVNGVDVVGAAWCRLFPASEPGYGFVDEQTPELTISVEPDWRGQGVGQRLLRALIERLQNEGYAQASLSVSRDNPAADWYRRLGFETVSEDETSLLMLLKLR